MAQSREFQKYMKSFIFNFLCGGKWEIFPTIEVGVCLETRSGAKHTYSKLSAVNVTSNKRVLQFPDKRRQATFIYTERKKRSLGPSIV